MAGYLFANNLHQHPFATVAIEFAVEDLLPGPKVEPAFGDGDDDFAAHDLAFHMGISVILAGAIVVILAGGGVRGEFFEPDIVVMEQTVLRIIDKHTGGDVHGIDEAKPLLYAAAFDQTGDGVGDVDEAAPSGDF